MAVTAGGFAAARLAVTYWVRPNLASPVHESLSLTASSAMPGFGVQQPEGIVSLTPPTVGIPNGWVYSTAIVDKAGDAPTSQYLLRTCPTLEQIVKSGPNGSPVSRYLGGTHQAAPALGQGGFHACLQKLSATFYTVVTYQPASRYWPFQCAEMGIFLGAALALCGLTYSWLRRQYA